MRAPHNSAREKPHSPLGECYHTVPNSLFRAVPNWPEQLFAPRRREPRQYGPTAALVIDPAWTKYRIDNCFTNKQAFDRHQAARNNKNSIPVDKSPYHQQRQTRLCEILAALAGSRATRTKLRSSSTVAALSFKDYSPLTAYCLRFVQPLHSATVFTLERLVRFRGLILALMGARPGRVAVGTPDAR